jgi:hypothetical protein
MAGGTYDNQADADVDRELQRTLLPSLNAWDRALRRDECAASCISGKHGRLYTWGDGQDLGGVDRLPLEAALDPHQEAARLLHRHPGRGRRGVPEVASPTDGRADGGHSRRAGDPQAGRTHAGDARAAASPDCHLKWSGVPGWRSRQGWRI